MMADSKSDIPRRSSRIRIPTMKANELYEARVCAETKALGKFLVTASKVESSMSQLKQDNGACSEIKLDVDLSELCELKKKLDAAYKKVESTAISTISSTVQKKKKKLSEELSFLRSRIDHANDEHREQKDEKCEQNIENQQPIPKTYDNESYVTRTSSNEESRSNTSCSTKSNSTTSYNGSSDSHGTIVDYLTNYCDYDTAHYTDVLENKSHTSITELAKLFADSMNATRLPIPEPEVFTGSPLAYPAWKASFDRLIDSKSISHNDKIHYLKMYLCDDIRPSIECLSYINDATAYERAREILDKRYGNSFLVSEAIRDKLQGWPKINKHDAYGLRNFADFLQQCNTAIHHIEGLYVLNDCRENKKLVAKLPDWLINRWKRIVARETTRYPSFNRFTLFITEEADILCDPVLFDLGRYDDREHLHANRATQKPYHKHIERRALATELVNKSDQCELCHKMNHSLAICRIFISKTPEERRTFIMEKGICYSCFNKGHRAKDCKNKLICNKCKYPHPTSLCGDMKYFKEKSNVHRREAIDVTKLPTSHGQSMKVSSSNDADITTMIVPVFVSSENSNESILIYALQDSQSDSTFISDAVASQLNTRSERVNLRLSTMTNTSTIQCRKFKNLKIRGFDCEKALTVPTTYTREIIPASRDHIPTCDTAAQWRHLQCLKQKIPTIQNCEIGMLIGYNCSLAIKPRDVISGDDDEPYGVRTHLGWSIVGRTSVLSEDSCSSIIKTVPSETMLKDKTNRTHYILRTSCKEVLHILESDFIERKCEGQVMSQEDIQFMKIMKEETRIDEDGFYEMPLPLKTNMPTLYDNKVMAEKRLQHLKKKLENNKELHNDYKTFIEMMISNKYAEEIPEASNDSTSRWYLPHHAVRNPKKPTSLRIVFDCSAKYRGCSLNDCLLQGPDLLNSIVSVFCKFREHQIAFIGDVEKMFYRFKVKEEHRNYLCYLWWKNGDLSTDPVSYRVTVHIFGATSSPGCANFALKRLANDKKDMFSKRTVDFIHNQFYVDDGLCSVETIEDAIHLVDEARELCNLGRLRLHKFVSNSKELLEHIPTSEQASVMHSIDLTLDDLPIERALGIQWNTSLDTLQFTTNCSTTQKIVNRRGALSIIASLYDPLGCVAPFVLVGKLILQKMCREDIGWDDPLPQHMTPMWNTWLRDFENIHTLSISRCFIKKEFGTVKRRELHHFSDASTDGYGQCSYLRQISENGEVHCCLVIAKARVTPTKMTTIPRLELTAALLSVKMSKLLKSAFTYTIDEEYFYTDSTIVISYINNDAKRFHIYVSNRVQQIKEHSSSSQWHHVNSVDNPADHASRGMSIDALKKSNWFEGPAFLWNLHIQQEKIETIIQNDDPEVKAHVMHADTNTETSIDLTMLNRFSTWNKAIKVVMLCLKFYSNILQKKMKRDIDDTSCNDVVHYERAKHRIIKSLQQQVYAAEISILKNHKELPSGNRLASLDPFVDAQNMLRIGGRIRQASYLYGVKHPLIIPRESHITQLIIGHHHQQIRHQGRGRTMNELRSAGYWIVNSSRVVSSFIYNCVVCRKLRSKTQDQKMSNLPSDRLEISPPFTHCGVDCFGPFEVKDGRKVCKRYGLIVTCFSSRAIHIECLDDMTSDCFINALRCVISIRGPIRTIKCDQGTNFIGASHELREAMKEKFDQDVVNEYLLQQHCDFIFNSPQSSHMGGLWERQIRTIRSVLDVILYQHSSRLDTASLRTFLYEAMTIVNGRPLTLQNINDVQDVPLSPNHLLTFKSNVVLPPPGNFSVEDVYGRKRWRQVQSIANEFWQRWRKEYVLNLQSRQKWRKSKRDVQLGDIMMVKDDDVPRNCWKLGRVCKVLTDTDDHIRRVQLVIGDSTLTKDGKRNKKVSTLERPIHKLILICESEKETCD